MFNFLLLLIFAAVGAMLIFNFFFRVKVLKLYRYLVQHDVEFSLGHFFDEKRLKEEVLSRYSGHEKQIVEFIKMVKRSMLIASVLLVLIIAIGYILMKWR